MSAVHFNNKDDFKEFYVLLPIMHKSCVYLFFNFLLSLHLYV